MYNFATIFQPHNGTVQLINMFYLDFKMLLTILAIKLYKDMEIQCTSISLFIL